MGCRQDLKQTSSTTNKPFRTRIKNPHVCSDPRHVGIVYRGKFEILVIFFINKSNMENSPLRFLDYDVSLMLADQVRISKEVESRMFHVYIFLYKVPAITRSQKSAIHLILTRISKYWGDFWDEELSGQNTIHSIKYKHTLEKRIILYEQEREYIMARHPLTPNL